MTPSPTGSQIRKNTQLTRERVSEQEWKLRCDLAAAHRLIAHFVFVDMILENHGALICGTTLPEACIYHHYHAFKI